VIEHVRRVIADPRVEIQPRALTRTEPTRVSRTTSRAFTAIATTIREVFPGAIVAPALFLGATDGRQYERIADDVYRFVPFRLVASDLSRIHGTDERVSVQGLADAVRFYRRLLRSLAQ
jgi:carboxypeptidase PM20D1